MCHGDNTVSLDLHVHFNKERGTLKPTVKLSAVVVVFSCCFATVVVIVVVAAHDFIILFTFLEQTSMASEKVVVLTF
jgi:hypothetical protein